MQKGEGRRFKTEMVPHLFPLCVICIPRQLDVAMRKGVGEENWGVVVCRDGVCRVTNLGSQFAGDHQLPLAPPPLEGIPRRRQRQRHSSRQASRCLEAGTGAWKEEHGVVHAMVSNQGGKGSRTTGREEEEVLMETYG